MGLFIDGFDADFDQLKIKEISDKYQINREDIGSLTTPNEMTFNNEKLLALLEIVEIIKSKKIPKNKMADFLDNYVNTSLLVSAYQKNFDYYKTNYFYLEHISKEEIKNDLSKLSITKLLII